MPEHRFFRGGDWNATCDICGRAFKASSLEETWDASMRCSECWEPRHPQDFVRAVPDNPTPPWVRPWTPQFIPIAFSTFSIGEVTIALDAVIGGP